MQYWLRLWNSNLSHYSSCSVTKWFKMQSNFGIQFNYSRLPYFSPQISDKCEYWLYFIWIYPASAYPKPIIWSNNLIRSCFPKAKWKTIAIWDANLNTTTAVFVQMPFNLSLTLPLPPSLYFPISPNPTHSRPLKIQISIWLRYIVWPEASIQTHH